MGFRFIFLGMIFLFNPNVNVLDILPDFLGYALILYGLRKLRDMAPEMEEFLADAVKLTALSAARLAAVFFTYAVDDPGYLMIFSLVFSLGEIYLMLHAFSRFFDGLFFLASTHNGTLLLQSRPRKAYSLSLHLARLLSRIRGDDSNPAVVDAFPFSSAKRMTTAFIWIRGLTTIGPELTYLFLDKERGYVLAPYKTVLYIPCVGLALLFGILWLKRMLRLGRAVGGDAPFMESLEQDYSARIAPDTRRFLLRRARLGLLLCGLGCLFLCDLYIDGVDLLPDAIGGLLFTIGLLTMRRYFPCPTLLPVLSGVLTALSAFDWLYVRRYAGKYNAIGISRVPQAYGMYLTTVALSAAISLLTIGLFALFLRYLLGVVREHTGRAIESQFASLLQQERSAKRSMKIKLWFFTIFAALTALSCTVYTICLYYWVSYWLVNLAVSVVWIVLTLKTLSDLYTMIDDKYL